MIGLHAHGSARHAAPKRHTPRAPFGRRALTPRMAHYQPMRIHVSRDPFAAHSTRWLHVLQPTSTIRDGSALPRQRCPPSCTDCQRLPRPAHISVIGGSASPLIALPPPPTHFAGGIGRVCNVPKSTRPERLKPRTNAESQPDHPIRLASGMLKTPNRALRNAPQIQGHQCARKQHLTHLRGFKAEAASQPPHPHPR